MDVPTTAESDLRTAVDGMRRAREQLLATTAGLSSEHLARRRAGGWSIARVLAHVIESEGVYAQLLARMAGKPAPRAAEGAAIAEPASSAEAMGRLTKGRAALLAALEGIDAERLYRLVRFGHEEYSPLSLIENIDMHDVEHRTQILSVLSPAAPPPSRRERDGARTDVAVRPAVATDVPRLTEIYNHYIVHTPTTFDLVPFTIEQRMEWFAHYATTGRYRLLVAERDGLVVAYTSTSRWRPKQAYETTVEMTVICAPEAVGYGIGQQLYEVVFDAIAGEDIHAAVAGITLPNDGSCALHERFGFTRTATFPQVGRKFGRYWDVAWYERLFD